MGVYTLPGSISIKLSAGDESIKQKIQYFLLNFGHYRHPLYRVTAFTRGKRTLLQEESARKKLSPGYSFSEQESPSRGKGFLRSLLKGYHDTNDPEIFVIRDHRADEPLLHGMILQSVSLLLRPAQKVHV